MEIEGPGATPDPGRGKKRTPPPSTTSDEEDLPESTEWLVSESYSEDDENQGKTQNISRQELMTSQYALHTSLTGCARLV